MVKAFLPHSGSGHGLKLYDDLTELTSSSVAGRPEVNVGLVPQDGVDAFPPVPLGLALADDRQHPSRSPMIAINVVTLGGAASRSGWVASAPAGVHFSLRDHPLRASRSGIAGSNALCRILGSRLERRSTTLTVVKPWSPEMAAGSSRRRRSSSTSKVDIFLLALPACRPDNAKPPTGPLR